MKPRNLVIVGTEEKLKRLELEYRSLGYWVKRTIDSLIVYTLPQRKREKQTSKNRKKRKGRSR
jgi:hypothetical protein